VTRNSVGGIIIDQETFMETDYDRGIFNAGEVPGDHTCLLQTL